MKRGAVIIGVNKYNDSELPDLRAAVQGAKEVAKWAKSNGFEVKCIIDEERSVKFERVQKAIEYFTSRTGDQRLEQLLVYFSGHGLNSGFNETWLLSNATKNGNEAINLASTIEMARYTTGITHIVFISDACRSAADTIDHQNITGGVAVVGQQKERSATIDRFYAARPGNPAAEVKDPLDPHGTYEAIYTKCLLDGLHGTDSSLIETLQSGLETLNVITSQSLKRYLEEEMPHSVVFSGLTRAQNPDAIIESRSPLYLARLRRSFGKRRIDRLPPLVQTQTKERALTEEKKFKSGEILRREKLIEYLKRELELAMNEPGYRDALKELYYLSRPTANIYQQDPDLDMGVPGDVVVVGADVDKALSVTGKCEVFSRDHRYARIAVEKLDQSHALPVLVQFADGQGALIGVFSGYRCSLLMDHGELASVTYDLPHESWMQEGKEKERLRALRKLVAAAAREGVFRIKNEEARKFGNRIRIMKKVDPTLGIYAAYAYHQIGLLQDVCSVADYMRRDLDEYLPFDVAMLLRTPDNSQHKLDKVVPYCPMLTQGWALLPAKRVDLPPLLEAAGRHLAPSLWTLFKPEGVRLLLKYMSSGEFS